MRRFVKITAGLAAVVVGSVVVLAVLVNVLVTPERVKAVVVPLAESALHREVSLGEIKIGLFSGIEVHDLAIAERNGDGSLLTVDLARLRFQWLPLLAKRVVVDEIRLERPKVRVSRDSGGALSIADLLGAAGSGAETRTKDRGPAVAGAISLLVAELQVADGKLVFIDHATGSAQPVRIELSDLSLQAAGSMLDGNVPLQLSGLLNGAPLAVDGSLRLKEKGGRFNVELHGFDALAIAPYFQARLPGELGALRLDLRAEADRSAAGVTTRGTLTGTGLVLRLAAFPAAPIDNAAVRVDFDLTSHPEREELDLRRLALDFNGLELMLAGQLKAVRTQPNAELTVTVPGLDLRQALTAFPRGMLGRTAEMAPSGLLRGELHLSGELARPSALLRQGTVVLEEVQGSVAGVRPTFNGRLALAGDRARIEQLTVNLGAIAATVSGSLEQLFTKPTVALAVDLPRTDLAVALATVPPELLPGVAGMSPSGELAAQAGLAGPLAKPHGLLKHAEVTLAGVQLAIGGHRPELNGQLKFAGERLVTEGLSVRLAGNTAQIKASLRGLFGEALIATLDIDSPRFQIEPLLQGGGAAAAATGKEQAPPPAGELGPFDLPLQASGTIRIGKTAWKGLQIRALRVDYVLRDNLLTISRLAGQVAGGAFSNAVRLDLRQPGLAYSADLDVQGVQADALLTALVPAAAGSLSGVMELKGSLKGSGTRRESIIRSLTGDGTLLLADGHLASPALVKGLSAFLALPEIDRIDFKNFRGKYRIVDGRLEVDSALHSSRLKLYPKGSLGLDGSLNLAVDTRISPDLAQRIDRQGEISGFLVDSDGWSQLPLLITGSCQAPRFGLDPIGIREQASRALQQQLQRGIDKLLVKPPPAAGQPDGPSTRSEPTLPATAKPQSAPDQQVPLPKQPAPPERKLLDEKLRNLLGR